jgi:outer membrane protein OmpA-like peptidoglycan-associated protein
VDVAFQERVALGVPILPPWEAYLGLSYNWDPVVRGSVKTIEKIKTVTAPAPPPVEEKGQIGGTVVDADTSKPIGGAFVTVDGMDLPPVATTPSEGRFQTYELREGPVNVTVTKDGYAAGSAHAMVEKGKTVQVSVTLKSEVHPIALHLKIRSSKGKATEASVSIHGPKDFKQDVNVPDSGEADATLPNPGAYTLEVSASGLMAKGAAVTAVANQPATAEVELSPKPKKSGVSVSATKIQLKKQLHFATDGSEIQSDSFAVLDEVVDAIIQGHLKVKVAAHTDNQGSKEHNLALSQERADAVKAYLEKAGVPADHLEAVGYGDTKPIAPNFTNRGRALNRRTEFEIQ